MEEEERGKGKMDGNKKVEHKKASDRSRLRDVGENTLGSTNGEGGAAAGRLVGNGEELVDAVVGLKVLPEAVKVGHALEEEAKRHGRVHGSNGHLHDARCHIRLLREEGGGEKRSETKRKENQNKQ